MKIALVLITGVVSLATLGVATASAAPPSNGCPPGMLYWNVAANQANYPNAPAATDNPANGGNGDGFVCAVALGKQRTPSGNQLYLFFDNQLPASYSRSAGGSLDPWSSRLEVLREREKGSLHSRPCGET